jgi:hypothetical protein
MKWPPKNERAVGSALKTAELLGAYHLLHLLQVPFGFVFWRIEQLKSRLQDQTANERGTL